MSNGFDSFDELLASDDSRDAQRRALKQRAIALLARRDYSRRELEKKLQVAPRPRRQRQGGGIPGRAGGRRRAPREIDVPPPAPEESHERDRRQDEEALDRRPSPELIAEVLDDLVELRLLSDRRMAESLVRSGAERFGAARLSQELQRKGLGEELVSDVLAPLADNERERAQALWERRFGRAPDSLKEKARQYRFLLSRGFSSRTVSAVVPRIEAGGDVVDDDEDFMP